MGHPASEESRNVWMAPTTLQTGAVVTALLVSVSGYVNLKNSSNVVCNL